MPATLETGVIMAYATPGTVFVWVIPFTATLAVLTWVFLTRASSDRKIHPDRRNDQTNHRGMEQGGTYTYRPGMFSHSYPPEKSTQFDEFQRDNPQPGREPKVPPEKRVYLEQPTVKVDWGRRNE
ncbi:hypothetical protein BJF79_27020 [Actinomadura sp. CNU-125]|uniref:hypothetical protein n=1 Tax=Actinomadura sp. CNU-125 TaxID=1904961 RepID=UPI00096362B6|nr:hypothetical protein [Actinomadura sp. CNU-125]OLT38428.1 hypothetical protein BJF79_27020 [Actinomadura sp. CNU-125]